MSAGGNDSGNELVRTLKVLAGQVGPPSNLMGVVKSVDAARLSCVVTVAGLDIDDVRLQALLSDGAATPDFVIVPKVGSDVVIGIIEGQPGLAYVAMVDQVEAIYLGGSNNGGMVKATPVHLAIQRIEQDLNNLKQALAAAPVVPGDGGAAFKAGLAAYYGQLISPLTQASQLQNSKVKH